MLSKRVREALEHGIQSWAKIATSRGRKIYECYYDHMCLLCQIYNSNCDICVVHDGDWFCCEPFAKFSVMIGCTVEGMSDYERYKHYKTCREYAWAVHDHLVSCLYQRRHWL